MPGLTNANLTDLGLRLKFLKNDMGICHGFSCALLLALWDGYLDEFINLLELINQHKEHLYLLVEKTKNAREKLKAGEILSPSENLLLKIRAFFAEVALYQDPSLFKEFFNDELRQNDFLDIYSLISSNGDSSPDMLLDITRAFTKNSLFSFLSALNPYLSNDNPALLGGDDHTVLLSIDEQTGLWLYADINKLAEDRPFYRVCSIYQLVNLIFSSFNDHLSNKKRGISRQFQHWFQHRWSGFENESRTVFNIKIPSKMPNSLLKKQLKKLATQFSVDANQLAMRNQRQVNIFEMLVADGALLAIKDLLARYPHFNINNSNDNGETSLHVAVANGREEIVGFLLNQQAIELNYPNNEGCTPIFTGIQKKTLGCIRLLLQHPDIDINYMGKTGETPLTTAVKYGNLLEVQELLTHPQLDVNKDNHSSKSPLFLAAELNHFAIVHALLKAGAATEGNFYCSVTALQQSLSKYSVAAGERAKQFIGKATSNVFVSPLEIAELLGYDEATILLRLNMQSLKLMDNGFELLQVIQNLPDYQKKSLLGEFQWLVQQDDEVRGAAEHFIAQTNLILESKFPEVDSLILSFADAIVTHFSSQNKAPIYGSFFNPLDHQNKSFEIQQGCKIIY